MADAIETRAAPPDASEPDAGRRPGQLRGDPVDAGGRAGEREAELRERLVSLGVSRATSGELVDEHPISQVLDALDAVEVLDGGSVRRPAGWVVAAVRDGWDLSDVLAERREQQARERRWRRQQERRDRQDAEYADREARAGRWCAAISAELDDRRLEAVIRDATEPVGALNRRSVPVVRAQILAWAVAAVERQPQLPLSAVLEHELAMASPAVASPPRHLPVPPDTGDRTDDLAARIAALFDTHSDLARPARDPSPDARDRGRDLSPSPEL